MRAEYHLRPVSSLLHGLLLTATIAASAAQAAHLSAREMRASSSRTSYDLLASGYDGRVHLLRFTPPSTLEQISSTEQNAAGTAPSWITFREDDKIAYVTSEEEPGRVHRLSYGALDEVSGSRHQQPDRNQLRIIGDPAGVAVGGSGPVAGCIVDRELFVANYNSGSASVLALKGARDDFEPDASIKPTVFQFSRKKGTVGPVRSRQDKSYAHDAVASPDGEWVYVPDLGADTIHHIRAAGGGAKEPTVAGQTDVPAGSGPRHIAFYEGNGASYGYLASELANTLTVFTQHSDTGKLRAIGVPQSAVPHGVPLGGNATAGPARSVAEVQVSDDGRFVYVSNRGDPQEDHIAIFRRDEKSGAVQFQGWIGTTGKNPRHFSLTPDDKFLAVAHQDTGNVVVLARDASSGKLTPTGAKLDGLEMVAFAGFVPHIGKAKSPGGHGNQN